MATHHAARGFGGSGEQSGPPCHQRDHNEVPHKLIEELLLHEVWMKAMCVELGRLSQGYTDIEGTNTIEFLTLEEIAAIPVDRTIMYARIAVE